MAKKTDVDEILTYESIEQKIYVIRGQRVILTEIWLAYTASKRAH
jgi:hypothetical protein